MKAFVLEDRNKAIIKELEKPQLMSEYDAILSPVAMSVCTSDVNTVYGTGSRKAKDLILGHECVAKVIKAGSEVFDFKKGDIVVVPAMTPDWRNPYIQDNNILHAGTNFSANTLGRTRPGVFAEEFIVSNADLNLALVPKDVSIADALMCVDMVTTGFTGVERANIVTGDVVVVIGIGAVGLMAIQAASLHGAGRIIAIGSRAVSKDLAYKYGANDIYDYKEMDVVAKVLNETEIGADVVIICGGNDEVLSQAVDMARYGVGRIVNLKLFSGDGNIYFSKFNSGRGMSGKSIYMELGKGGRIRMERLLSMVKYKRISPRDLITHKFYGFDSIYKCLDLMKNKGDSVIKTMLIPEWIDNEKN